MHYRTLPQTDLNISILGLGTWAMGNDFWGSVEDRESIAAIHAAMDAGINLIDTAPAYGAGHAETVVGKAIKGKRDHVVLATKTGVIRTKDGFIRDLSPRNIAKDMEASLRRLGTECIDLYQIHWPDANTPLADSMAALMKLKQQGKFRYLGVSNFSVDLIEEARQFIEIVSLQPNFSMVQRKVEAETLPYCLAEKIGLITYGTLAGGLLTGKYRSLPTFTEQDKRARFYDYYKPELWPLIQGLLQLLDTISANHHCTLAQIAIAWAAQQKGITSALVGAKHPEQSLSNAKAASIHLSNTEYEAVDRYLKKHLRQVVF